MDSVLSDCAARAHGGLIGTAVKLYLAPDGRAR